MKIRFRTEQTGDHISVEKLIETAFAEVAYSDHREAHQRAEDQNFSMVVLLGHENYYPRFGYEPASQYGITFPFDAPDENCMIKVLQPGALDGISGQVAYPEAFNLD